TPVLCLAQSAPPSLPPSRPPNTFLSSAQIGRGPHPLAGSRCPSRPRTQPLRAAEGSTARPVVCLGLRRVESAVQRPVSSSLAGAEKQHFAGEKIGATRQRQ